MNIQDYISSGIIESYVLGLASAEERVEFERLCTQYPELVEERTRFEIALENQLLSQATPPPPAVKEGVMNAIRQQSHVNQTKIITMESNTNRSSSPLRWVAAASVILLLGSAFFAYKFYSQTQELQARINSNDSTMNAMLAEQKRMAEEQKITHDPNVAVVNMVGTEKAPASSASVYWDSTSANVYLVVKNMPELPNDKQYQLWALIGGQPKNLGLFDIKGTDKKFFLKMENTQKADAFAITIENKGNTGGPDYNQLQNMGKAKL